MTTYTAPVTYRNSSKHPIRFDRLHPGSLFKIVAERERGIIRSNDQTIYQRARDGFYSEQLGTKKGIVLLPEDLVMPVVREKAR